MPDGAVLFSTDTEIYYSLNAIGAFIWRLLPRTVEELCAAVQEEHPDVTRTRIEEDIVALLKALEASSLIEWKD